MTIKSVWHQFYAMISFTSFLIYYLQDPISAGTWHKLTLVDILLHMMAVCMSLMELENMYSQGSLLVAVLRRLLSILSRYK